MFLGDNAIKTWSYLVMLTGRRDYVNGNKVNDKKTWTLWDQPSSGKGDGEVVLKWDKKKRGLSVSVFGLVRRLRRPRSKDVSWVLSNTQKPNHRIPQNKLSNTQHRIIKYPKTKLPNTQNNHQIPKTIIRYQYVAVSILQSHIQYKVSYQRVVFSFMHGPLHWRNDSSCKSSSRWGMIGALLRLNTIIL